MGSAGDVRVINLTRSWVSVVGEAGLLSFDEDSDRRVGGGGGGLLEVGVGVLVGVWMWFIEWIFAEIGDPGKDPGEEIWGAGHQSCPWLFEVLSVVFSFDG